VGGDLAHVGHAVLTLCGDNREEHVTARADHERATGAIETVPGRYRTVVLSDPEGNRIASGENLSTDD